MFRKVNKALGFKIRFSVDGLLSFALSSVNCLEGKFISFNYAKFVFYHGYNFGHLLIFNVHKKGKPILIG